MRSVPSRIDTSALLDRIDLAAVITADRGAPDRARKWLCPFHPDHKPSLSVSRDGKRWRCWSCQAKGNAIDWMMKRHDLSFPKACARLDPRIGMAPSGPARAPTKPVVRPAAKEAGFPRGKRKEPAKPLLSPEAAGRMVAEAAARLWTPEGAACLAYLHRRGLTDPTIRAARLGWTPRAEGVTRWEPPGLVIPWIDAGGAVAFLKVRPDGAWRSSLPPDRRPPKYLAPKGWKPPEAVYPGPGAIVSGRPVVIVEGELDALLLGQALGDMASVVTFGSASNGPTPGILGALRIAPAWYVAHDADRAGDKAAAVWTNTYRRARRVRPPEPFKDWTEAGTDAPDSTGTALDLARWWGPILNGGKPGPAFTADDLDAWRWGPALDDPEAGIDSRGPGLVACDPEARCDPYAVAEREAMQSERDGA
jgi:DNA primase